MLTLVSLIASLSVPKINLEAAEVKVGNPLIGKYSWSNVSSLAMIDFAYWIEKRIC